MPARDSSHEVTHSKPCGSNRASTGYYWTNMNAELERFETLEVLAMVLAHLNYAEANRELSPRVPLLMGIRDKLAAALREDGDGS